MANEIQIRLVVDKDGAVRSFAEFVQTARTTGTQAGQGVDTSIQRLRAGLQALRTEFERSEVGSAQFNRLRAAIEATEAKLKDLQGAAPVAIDQVGFKSGNARVAVMGFSQALSDAGQFQFGFNSGMRAIGNNLDFVAMALARTKAEAAAAGVSMKTALLSAITGPAGIMIGISALIVGLQLLPSLFRGASQAAGDAAEEGFKKFADVFKSLSPQNQAATIANIRTLIDNVKKRMDEIKASGTTFQFRTAQGPQSTTVLTQAQQDEMTLLKERETLLRKFLTQAEEETKIAAELLNLKREQERVIQRDGDRYQKNVVTIEQLNERLKQGNLDVAQTARIKNRILDLETENEKLLKDAGLREKEKAKTVEQLAAAQLKELELAEKHYKLKTITAEQYAAILVRTRGIAQNEQVVVAAMERQNALERERSQALLNRLAGRDNRQGGRTRESQSTEPFRPSSTTSAGGGGAAPPPEGSILAQQQTVARLNDELNKAVLESDRERIRQQMELEQRKLDFMQASTEQRRQMWKEEHEFQLSLVRNLTSVLVREAFSREKTDVDALRRRNRLSEIEESRSRQDLQDQLNRRIISHEEYNLRVQQLNEQAAARRRELEEAQNAFLKGVFDGLERIAIGALERILQAELEKAIISMATTESTEAANTAATVEGSYARVAAKSAEASAEIGAATAKTIAASGPFAIFTAAAIIAAGLATLLALRKAFGFQRGGEIKKGESGFFEGQGTEIIAPRKTFEQIMYEEVVPNVARLARIAALNSPQQIALRAGTGGYDFGRLERRIMSLEKTLVRKRLSATQITNVDGERIVERNLIPVQQRQAEVKR